MVSTMSCFDPKLCYTTAKGKRVFRHFSKACDWVKKYHQEVFDCGKCLHCRKRDSKELAMRCVLHASLYGNENSFLTLTYDETQPDYNNILEYQHIQKFKKSLRSYCEYHFNKKIQVFNVHEYGTNGKKHWHLVCFNHAFNEKFRPVKNGPIYEKELHTIKNGHRLYTHEKLNRLWKHGFSTIGDVSEASAMYTAQYTQKDIKNGNAGTDSQALSKHSGIGKEYFLKYYSQIMKLGYVPFDSKKMKVPRYFEKLAHKHWCHYYDRSYFYDLIDRKKRYGFFKPGEANKEIAELYPIYQERKKEFIKEKEALWKETMKKHLETGKQPDFARSGENQLYDLKRKISKEIF